MLSRLIQALPIGSFPSDLVPHFGGARLFAGKDFEGGSLWLADLARTISDPIPRIPRPAIPLRTLVNHYFISANGWDFHQLKTVEYSEGMTLTEAPGLGQILITMPALDALLFYDQGGVPGMVRLALPRISPENILIEAAFHCLSS